MSSVLSRIRAAFTELRGIDNPAFPLTATALWNEMGSGPSVSGENITERTAMSISTVYTCVTILAEAVASLPCKLMKRTSSGRAVADDHALYVLLAASPNPEMSAFTFWSTIVGSSALCGNGYAQIIRDSNGLPESIWPLHPLKTEPVRLPNGDLAFRTSDGMAEGKYRIVKNEDILHFPLFSLDGIKGVSPVAAAREAFSTAKAMEKYGARYFSNGATSPVVYVRKGEEPDGKAQAEFISSWRAAHSGSNQHKDGFLFGDWDVKSIGLSPEDSQFLSSKNYQRADVAAMYKIPPQMVGSQERMSNANYVQQTLSFMTETIRPILVRIEQEVERKLLPKVGPNAGKLFITFDVSERLRGDFQSQMQAYAIGRQWGFFCVNDIRANLGMNPIGPAGDLFLYPVNMGDAQQLLEDKSLIPITQQPVGSETEDDKPDEHGKKVTKT